jgi:two-component system sensor histidine kinase
MNNNKSSMRHYEGKTKEELLEIIEQLEKKK